MPINPEQINEIRGRVYNMFMDTIHTFELIEENADRLFGDNANEIKNAINEYLNDFMQNVGNTFQVHPETLIFENSPENFERAGFYGSQLTIKERQVTTANDNLRGVLGQGLNRVFRRSFTWWIDVINNFLGSLISGLGMAEALKELKDCLRNDLPEEE